MNLNLSDKILLNTAETIKEFNLSARKFDRFLKNQGKLPFVVSYRSRRLIVKDLFENYLNENPRIKEGLASATRKQ